MIFWASEFLSKLKTPSLFFKSCAKSPPSTIAEYVLGSHWWKKNSPRSDGEWWEYFVAGWRGYCWRKPSISLIAFTPGFIGHLKWKDILGKCGHAGLIRLKEKWSRIVVEVHTSKYAAYLGKVLRNVALLPGHFDHLCIILGNCDEAPAKVDESATISVVRGACFKALLYWINK